MKPNGKILGVLGGMGPAAAADFLRLLALHAPGNCDQEHPVVYMLGDTTLPDRSEAMLGQGRSPLLQMKQDFFRLQEWGADILCAPCNSAHYFIDQFKDELSRPFIHIIEETLAEAERMSQQGSWLLGTKGTLRTGLYQQRARENHYPLHEPDEIAREYTATTIQQIKAGDFKQAAQTITLAAQHLWEIEDIPIVLACTELPLAYQAARLPDQKSVSSLDALAKACIRELYE